jgi:hypothetical protein
MALPTIPLQFGDFGNALASGAHARYYTENSNKLRNEERRLSEAMPQMEAAAKGDPSAMAKVSIGAPKEAVALSTMLSRIDANKRADIKAAAEYTTQAANAILQADPAQRGAIYKQLYADGVARGYNMGSLPPEYNSSIDPMLRTHRQMGVTVLEQFKQEQLNARHNSPGGGASPSYLEPLARDAAPAPAPAAPAPAPAAPAGRPMSSVMPGGPAPTNVAAAPPAMSGPNSVAQGDGFYTSADPSIKDPPAPKAPPTAD